MIIKYLTNADIEFLEDYQPDLRASYETVDGDEVQLLDDETYLQTIDDCIYKLHNIALFNSWHKEPANVQTTLRKLSMKLRSLDFEVVGHISDNNGYDALQVLIRALGMPYKKENNPSDHVRAGLLITIQELQSLYDWGETRTPLIAVIDLIIKKANLSYNATRCVHDALKGYTF